MELSSSLIVSLLGPEKVKTLFAVWSQRAASCQPRVRSEAMAAGRTGREGYACALSHGGKTHTHTPLAPAASKPRVRCCRCMFCSVPFRSVPCDSSLGHPRGRFESGRFPPPPEESHPSRYEPPQCPGLRLGPAARLAAARRWSRVPGSVPAAKHRLVFPAGPAPPRPGRPTMPAPRSRPPGRPHGGAPPLIGGEEGAGALTVRSGTLLAGVTALRSSIGCGRRQAAAGSGGVSRRCRPRRCRS